MQATKLKRVSSLGGAVTHKTLPAPKRSSSSAAAAAAVAAAISTPELLGGQKPARRVSAPTPPPRAEKSAAAKAPTAVGGSKPLVAKPLGRTESGESASGGAKGNTNTMKPVRGLLAAGEGTSGQPALGQPSGGGSEPARRHGRTPGAVTPPVTRAGKGAKAGVSPASALIRGLSDSHALSRQPTAGTALLVLHMS